MILVDSNILIDIFEPDPIWFEWSSAQLDSLADNINVNVTPIVVAEVGPRFVTLNDFYSVMSEMMILVDPMTNEAAFLAGQAFREYRRVREGSKSILADFLIGGQAAVSNATILTRDPTIYARYFPSVPLITPDKV